MRLIEVVVLMGAHCVSPVQHTPSMTEAGKVQCAVMVEKDTESGNLKVTPETAAQDPRVTEAIRKLEAEAAGSPIPSGTTIVPVGAPPGTGQPQPVPAVKQAPPKAEAPVDDTARNQTADGPAAAPAEPVVQPPPPVKAKQNTLQCKGGAVPQWYAADNGRRKYRCVKS